MWLASSTAMPKTEEACLHGESNLGNLCYGKDGNKVKVIEGSVPATKSMSMIRSRISRDTGI